MSKLQQLRLQLARLLELPAEVAELGRSVRDARTAAEAVLALAQRPRPRWAQLLVLWQPEPLPAGAGAELRELGPGLGTMELGFRVGREPRPGLLSLSFDLNDEQTKRSGVRSDTITYPIPAGAWLVACGCLVSQVFVGNELQDIGSGLQGLPVRVLRLRDPIGVGVYLRCAVVKPDDGGSL